MLTTSRWGATPDDWLAATLLAGLTEDLLPVVSNPGAQISAQSKLKTLGKTPSLYNANRHVVGLPDWTSKRSTEADVRNWQAEADLGLCIQTRALRAIDVDVTDAAQAAQIVQVIEQLLPGAPRRCRSNSPKFLVPVYVGGELGKRRIITAHGAIEFLATGQQFVAYGTHPSGVRYEWSAPLWEAPATTVAALDGLWGALQARFGVAPESEQAPSSRAQRAAGAAHQDSIGAFLIDQDLVLATDRSGALHITCPFAGEHTSPDVVSSTTYWPAHTGGYEKGHFKCLHAHCSHRTDSDFLSALGYAEPSLLDEFDQVEEGSAPKLRFAFEQAAQFATATPARWIIKGVLPQAQLGVVYGDSGSGKTFFALDLVMAIATGTPWRGLRTRQGPIAYICAEGAGGFRNRLKAYASHKGLELGQLPLHVLGAAPNFMARVDVKDLLEGIRPLGPLSVIVIDTAAKVMPGANENSGEDVGRVLGHCEALSRATGALVVLIHHSGKDATKGARGWSGLRAAADVEIEIIRADQDRVATVTKSKDGEDGAEFGFRLQAVAIGQDEDGEAITSCVIETVEGGARRADLVNPEPAARGGKQRLVLRILSDAAELGADQLSVNDLVQACVDQIPQEVGQRDFRRRHVMRALESLVDSQKVALENGFVKVSKENGK